MKIQIRFLYLFFFFISSVERTSQAADQALPYPTLEMHDYIYQNSCAPEEKSKLMVDAGKHRVPDRQALAKLLELILCADHNDTNSKKIFDTLDKVIFGSYESTGDQRSTDARKRKLGITKEIMAEHNAWNSRIDADEKKITLQYFSNEACVKSVSLRYIKKEWKIYEIGEACD